MLSLVLLQQELIIIFNKEVIGEKVIEKLDKTKEKIDRAKEIIGGMTANSSEPVYTQVDMSAAPAAETEACTESEQPQSTTEEFFDDSDKES